MRYLSMLILTILLSSCLKEVTEANELNNNIFDKEYQGEQWFNYLSVSIFENGQGFLRVKVSVIIPSENVPLLHPYSIDLYARVNNQVVGSIQAIQNNKGDYPLIIEALIDGSQTYCLELSMYDEKNEEFYNTFTECKSL